MTTPPSNERLNASATAPSATTSSFTERANASATSTDDDDDDDRKGAITDNLAFLQSLGAITGRGEYASKQQNAAAKHVLMALERKNPTESTARSDLLLGTWELAYCSTQLFRSSPFFMAGRAVCRTDAAVRQYNWFCDVHRASLAISRIESVRQIVSASRLVSEIEVRAGAIPFLSDVTRFSYSGGLPVTISGALVSTANITATATDGNGWDVSMDTVEIKGSNVPVLRQLLDSRYGKLRSRKLADILERNIASYETPKPVFRTTYLDDRYRISRDQDDNFFF